MPLWVVCHIPSGHVSSNLKSYYLLNSSETEALLYDWPSSWLVCMLLGPRVVSLFSSVSATRNFLVLVQSRVRLWYWRTDCKKSLGIALRFVVSMIIPVSHSSIVYEYSIHMLLQVFWCRCDQTASKDHSSQNYSPILNPSVHEIFLLSFASSVLLKETLLHLLQDLTNSYSHFNNAY